jgi:hypothetical protein
MHLGSLKDLRYFADKILTISRAVLFSLVLFRMKRT